MNPLFSDSPFVDSARLFCKITEETDASRINGSVLVLSIAFVVLFRSFAVKQAISKKQKCFNRKIFGFGSPAVWRGSFFHGAYRESLFFIQVS